MRSHDPRAWFAVEEIDAGTFVISEPRYWQRNNSYLLVGTEQALLVDSGSGRSDISSVVRSLTDRPVTTFATHLHWDHIGGHDQFDAMAILDHPAVRGTTGSGDVVAPPWRMRLIPARRRLAVTSWLASGARIDLGGRSVVVHQAPGHTVESAVVHEPDRGLLFTGDLLYNGPIAYGLLPGSNVSAAQATTVNLVRQCPSRLVLGGHYGILDGSRLSEYAAALTTVDVMLSARQRRDVTPLRSVRIDGFHLILGPGVRSRSARPSR